MPVWIQVLGLGLGWWAVGMVGAWYVLRRAFGDRWWWLFMLNTAAAYLFLPLLLVLPAALAAGRPALALCAALGLLLGLRLYGHALPRRRPALAPGAPPLTLLTWNLLAYREQAALAVEALRSSGADVIALQELNPCLAAALGRELRAVYPYQWLDASPTDMGMGLLSRFPLRATGQVLDGPWIGAPQIAAVDAGHVALTVINLHNVSFPSGHGSWRAVVRWSAHERERQAHRVAAFAARHEGPLVVCGDFNTGEMSAAYAILRAALCDAWRQAGRGMGHTFPGGSNPRNNNLSVSGVRVPWWLVRIDYIFHTRDIRARAAYIGPWDGVSDHRPVVAELQFPAGPSRAG